MRFAPRCDSQPGGRQFKSETRYRRLFISPNRRRPHVRSDARETPAYGLAEAARYVRVPVATLRSWVVGRAYATTSGTRRFERLISAAAPNGPTLSFLNLIEAHVLRALRIEHSVSIRDVRTAVRYAERELGIDRLFLRRELRTSGKELFLDRYGQLLSLSRSGQLVMRATFEAHLQRIRWDHGEFPARLYPFLALETDEAEPAIAVDPQIAFGRPTVARRGISTQVIASRIDAGEAVDALAEDYDLTQAEIAKAVLLERAA